MNREISVIIPTLNRPDSLLRTFEFMEKSSILPDEVIVIDQTQDKNVAGRIRNICDSSKLNIKYTWISTPSTTITRNIGFSLANGEILVYMDDDVDVKQDTFSNVREIFSDESIAMAGRLSGSSINRVNYLGVLFGRFSLSRRRIGHVTKSVLGRFPVKVEEHTDTEWAMGFFFCIRRKLMEEWNLRFDENLKYYGYAEDLDFTYRYFKKARKEGLQCIMSNLLSVRHNVSKEYRTPSRNSTFFYIVHRWYLCRKLFNSRWALLSVIWADFAYMAMRALQHESVKDVWDALKFSIRNRNDIFNGEMHYPEFMS